MVDDDSYTWDSVFPYYKKSVRFTPPNVEKRNTTVDFDYDASAFDSNGGPLQVTYTNHVLPMSPNVVKAFSDIGIKAIDAYNSGELLGQAPLTLSIDAKDETRSSSETSFLQESLKDSTIVVYLNTLATKILFDGKKATGVSVSRSGVDFKLSASKSVILSAGSVSQCFAESNFLSLTKLQFLSPKLLMLSGIGPRATLESFGISVLSDLPGVGQNMHVCSP